VSLAAFRERREEQTASDEREEALSFLPLQFDDSLVRRSGDLVEVIVSRTDAIGVVFDRGDAVALANALLKAARWKPKRGKKAHPRGNVARDRSPRGGRPDV
jgi:hypothetical protein